MTPGVFQSELADKGQWELVDEGRRTRDFVNVGRFHELLDWPVLVDEGQRTGDVVNVGRFQSICSQGELQRSRAKSCTHAELLLLEQFLPPPLLPLPIYFSSIPSLSLSLSLFPPSLSPRPLHLIPVNCTPGTIP